MSGSDFSRILDIKQRREDRARSEVAVAEAKLKQAVEKVVRLTKEAEDFEKYVDQCIEDTYSTLEERGESDRTELENARDHSVALREQQAAKYEKVTKAEEERKQALSGLNQAKAALDEAMRNSEKFRELVADEKSKAKMVERLEEDNALEDLHLNKPLEMFDHGGEAPEAE